MGINHCLEVAQPRCNAASLGPESFEAVVAAMNFQQLLRLEKHAIREQKPLELRLPI